MTERTHRLGWSVALGLLLALAACRGDQPPEDEMAPDEPTTTMEEMGPTTVELQSVNESGVSGEAMAMHSDDAVVVSIEVEGLPGEGGYAAHIHSGNCAEGGPVALPLNPVVGLADGTGSSTTTLDPGDIAEGDPYFIMVHAEGGTSIACGDVEGHGG